MFYSGGQSTFAFIRAPRWCVVLVCALATGFGVARQAAAVDVSPAPFLQWFEASYDTIENRTVDLHAAGYGSVWLPPPGRADISNFSVGYDVYNRFDLGTARNQTLYGTETGIKTVANTFHRAGVNLHIDAIINHNGFSDQSTPGFVESGGYPGFLIQDPDGGNDPFGVPGTDGDFNSAYDYGDLRGRLAGLIDIDHAHDFRFIRNPVPGFGPFPGEHGGNLPAGTTPHFGRLANVPDENNRRFYPDRDLNPIFVFDPITGEQNIPIYPFNSNDPLAGDPVGENATGYLMRYLQWMVQDVGVDGFRIDAAKHVEGFAFDFFDRAVYRQNPRLNLDGSTSHVFSYSEVFDGNRDFLLTHVVKTINDGDPGRIGGNRDALDFAQYFTLRDNLTGNGFANDWNNVVRSDLDFHDDGLKNGSAGVKFVQSHDEFGPHLNNVAHAYMLMHPGNAVVYFNGKEFGDNRDFPKDGRGDALGGAFGDSVTELVDIRNTHGRGNYIERWLEKELYAFEREGSSLVLLSNRLDGGFDSRTVNVNLPWGTHLIELTGNAKAWNDKVGNADIPEVIQVFDDGFGTQTKVNVRFLRNDGGDSGYLIYGLPTPQSDQGVELTNVSSVLSGGGSVSNGFENGITRLNDLNVITADSFEVKLRTKAVNLLGSIRDQHADGDNALLKVDGGLDVNNNGFVDFTSPSSVQYGFEEFHTFKSPGLFNGDGNGEYRQIIDTTNLSEGTHFITVRAFRHRTDNGPAVFSDFKKYIYVDRLPPNSEVASFDPFDPNFQENRDLLIRSVDKTADNVHVLLNLPAALSDAEVLNLLADGNRAGQIDRDLFAFGFFNVPHGNNVATVVSFEPTGNLNVQRFAGLFTNTINGRGLGDLNRDGQFTSDDIANVTDAFEDVLYSRDAKFNPAADTDGDGNIDTYDLLGLRDVLTNGGADSGTLSLYETMRQRRVDFDGSGTVDGADVAQLRSQFGGDDWTYDLNVDGLISQSDEQFLFANFQVVPEPSTLALTLLGLVGLAAFAWRRRSR